MLASRKGYLRITKKLLDSGADPNLQNNVSQIRQLSVVFFFAFFFFSRNQLSRKKKLSQKNHLAAVFDCRTIIVGYYNNSTCMFKQYRRSLPYRADRSARYGKGRLYCMRVLYTYVHRICT